MDFFGNYFWASQDEYVKPAIGGAMLFLNSARVVMNTIFSGVFDGIPISPWSPSRAASAGSRSSSRPWTTSCPRTLPITSRP